MANSRTIEFKGHFDGKQVLDELKKIRQNMADAGADDNLFKGIDKDIAATEKLVTEMMAQIQKGFSNTKEVNAFEKQIDKLQTNLLKISSGMQNVNIAENLGLNSPEITSLTRELEQLTAAQDHLKEVSKEALDQAKKSVGLRDDEIAKIKEAIDANEDLEEALKKVGKAKEKRFLSQAGEAGMQTQAGKDYIKNADAGLSLSDLGAKASSGNTAKAKNDARKRYDDGELYGNANNRQLDEVKAAAAVTEVYQKTLEKMITSGGNAAEAVEEMKKSLADYGIEIENTDQLQENFYNDIEGFYKSPAVDRGNKGNITKARKIGSTNAQGEYELSDASVQNFLNNSGVTAYSDNMRRATEVTNQLGQEIEEATRRTAELVNENDQGLNNAIQNTNNMTNATREGAEATREASESVEQMNNSFDNMKNAVKTFLSIGSVVSALRNVVRDTFNDIKELDKSFAKIAMVTDYSVQEMWSSYDQYAAMANELGQSTQSVIQASGLFYQQGLDTAESLALTEDTMKLATLAGLDFEKATSQMTAALRGFHMEMNEGGRVTDVYSELAAKAAADVQQIAYAMSKTASIASSAGMEFETTSAFLTQMIETTQEAPENIGTAMKTIIARFTELKENVAGTADSEFEDLDYNKVDTALKSVGVSLKDASGQFRDLDDVFLELSQKWNTLDRNSQRYIATIAAGSRQQSRFIAMMENYDRTIELVDTAYDSAGKSSEQFAKYQDTVEYKMNQISNSWEQLRTNFLDSDTYKGALDIFRKFMDTLNNMDAKQFIGIGLIGITLGKSVITNFIKGIQENTARVSVALDKFKKQVAAKFNEKTGKNPMMSIKYDTESIQKFESELRKINIDTDKLTTKQKNLLITYSQIPPELLEAKIQIDNQSIALMSCSDEALDRLVTEGKITAEIADQVRQYQKLGSEIDSLGGEGGNAVRGLNRQDGSNARNTGRDAQTRLETGGQVTSEAISTALTTGLMMAFSGADLKTTLITSLGSAFTSVISIVIPKLVTMAIEALVAAGAAATAAVVASVVVAAVAITAIIAKIASDQKKASEATEKAELNRLKNIEKINEDLEEKQANALQKASGAKKSKDELNDLVERFNFLSGKSFLNNEEQTELSSTKESLNNNYSDVVLSYDENTEEMKLNTTAIERLTEEYEQEYQDATKEAQFAQVTRVTTTADAEETAKQLSADYNKFYEIFESSNGKTLTEGFDTTSDEVNLYNENGEWLDTVSGLSFELLKTDLREGFGSDSELYKTLGLQDADLDNVTAFNDYLKDAGITLQDFVKTVAEASDEEAKRLKEEKLKQAREGAALVYQTYTDENGEAYSEELARSLSYGINEEDLTNTTSKGDYRDAISEGVEVNKNFLEDYLQAIQEGKSVENSGGVSDALVDMQVTADKTADDIIRDKIAEWKKNEEYLMDGSDGNLSEWAKLPAEMVSYLESQGYTEADWDDIRKDASESKEAINGYFYNLFLSEQEAFGQLSEEQLSANQSQLTEIQKVLSDSGNLTQQEYLDQLTEIVSTMDKEVRNSFLSGQGLKWENGKIIESGEFIQDSVYGAYTEAIETFSNKLKITGAEGLSLSVQQNLLNSIESANLGQGESAKFGQELVDFINNNNLSAEAQSVLSSIDFSQSYSELMATSQSYIEGLEEAGLSSEKAAQVFKDYISSAKNYIFSAIHNLEGISVLRENINTNFKNITENYSTLLDAQKEFFEEGELSSETYYKLLEEGFDEYVTITGKGYELLEDNVSSAFASQAKSQYENYLNAIEEQKKTIKILENNEGFEPITALDDFGGVHTLSSLQEAGEFYKNHTNQLEKYQGSYKQLIQEFVDSGLEWDEYILNLKETTAAMEEQSSEVYIQYLHTLSDAYLETKNELNDLNDELEDLNKQLADDQKAVDDAYKAWQEAIHGTEDYQSSLDGLLNYERRLESFNNKLEDTKEALSDVSNIDDARDLLEQTTSLYEGKLGTLKAESKVINQSLSNLDKEIMENYANLISLDEFGNMNVDISALESADMSDILKDDGFTQLLEKRNEMYDKARETDQAYLETVKEWEEQYKTARESEIKMEETVINILKEKMQEEVDTVKDKYAALEEADNNYLDALQEAIDKQRQLREQENQYEDLATKQKKLSLMQRDTSGANQKEVQKLEKEVEDDQQNLLDSEVDNLIESMQELYEKQKEARDLEIEAMEAETENMQAINETAMTIISGFQSVEDYQAWLLENDKTVEDMTVTQTEQYLDEAKETFSGYAQYVALTAEDMQLKADEINKQADLVFENTNENVSNIGTTIQELAVAASDKAEEEAKEAYDDAVEKMNETQKKIDETTKKIKEAEATVQSSHEEAMSAMAEASQSSMEDVATYAAKTLIEFSGLDLSDSEKVQEFAEKYNFVNADGEYSQGFINALKDKGYDTSNMLVGQQWTISQNVNGNTAGTTGQYNTKEEALVAMEEMNKNTSDGVELSVIPIETSKQVGAFKEKQNNQSHYKLVKDGKTYKSGFVSEEEAQAYKAANAASDPTGIGQAKIVKYAMGGLVNYTGPAWVDGTPTKPEAFLNAQDTQRIGEAAKILAQIPALNGASENVSTNIGDTTIEIHINVESIESDYDVDQMIERVKNDILDVSKPTGTSVILKK